MTLMARSMLVWTDSLDATPVFCELLADTALPLVLPPPLPPPPLPLVDTPPVEVAPLVTVAVNVESPGMALIWKLRDSVWKNWMLPSTYFQDTPKRAAEVSSKPLSGPLL